MNQNDQKTKQIIWWKVGVGILCIIGFLFLLVRVNQFEKAPLISTEGYTYEKAIVVAITKDNLAEDGNRYGTQEVVVQIKSGELKGQEFDAVNPSGSLFGAECEVGTGVIVIVSSNEDSFYFPVSLFPHWEQPWMWECPLPPLFRRSAIPIRHWE